ncbi:SGNH/GDSL hydrolase family protein [Actinacidiphila acidipaludis]|uniref:SGNH/GDSL hydrolase family protein n=1 Tax=Actinacidiphila acidipaludis TaxID=2873382 RepID=A0ABS7Q5Y9_9ACTN|nr:SGNH/GDSL hydrolase family protein [Streptomyces acidipaludis]MBY8878572.1 SGNH/GDSL hydrolase family protein [Streptomyces acidipaludis]
MPTPPSTPSAHFSSVPLSRLTLLLALVFSSLLTVAGASPAQAAGQRYVALGDSYSSGLGAGGYASSSGACKRSSKAYPALWAAAHAPASFVSSACAGALTGDIAARQLGPVSASTTLISVSVGGQDAGFSDVMTTCVFYSEATCLNRVAQARRFVDTSMPRLLDSTYAAIHAKGPNARVVVLGYPHLYQVPGDCLLGLTDASRKAIDAAADDLDTVIAKRAADHGFAFADVRGRFKGHELCSGAPWLHSVTLPVDESYHPTADGQSGGYLPAFTAAV